VIPLIDQIREIERELAVRRKVFPNWIRDRKISQAEADRRIATLEAVLTTLKKLWELEEISMEMRGEFDA
jgi:hypothetical protein